MDLGESVLLISGLDERGGGGLFIYDGSQILTVDQFASTGLAATSASVGRLLHSSLDHPPGARLLVYDEDGVLEFRRLDVIVDPHDLEILDDGSWLVVSSVRNTIDRVHRDGSIENVWQPSTVPDSWHINCVTIVDSEPWVTAFGRFSSARGWSGNASRGAGFLRNLVTGEEIGGLSQPHSPRFVAGRWWVCNSLEQTLVAWTGAEWERRTELRGYPRGLATCGRWMFVGESGRRGQEDEWSSLAVLEGGVLIDRIFLPAAEVYDVVVAPRSLVQGLRRGFNSRLPSDSSSTGVYDGLGDRRVFDGIGVRLKREEATTRIEVEPPSELRVGESLLLSAMVENRGGTALASTPPCPVNLSYRWTDDEGVMIDGVRTLLGRALFPGRTAQYEIELRAPEEPGCYSLAISLVQEGNFWFDDVALSNGMQFPVEVIEGSALAPAPAAR